MYKRFSNALHSSKAAIDLASIMVGIIVIGLIGAVIAATVFAVIPWAQIEGKKQQLVEIRHAIDVYHTSALGDGPVAGDAGNVLSRLRDAGLINVPAYDPSTETFYTDYWCGSLGAQTASQSIIEGNYVVLTFIAGEKFSQVVFMTRDHNPVEIKDFEGGADLQLLYQQACNSDAAYDGLIHN